MTIGANRLQPGIPHAPGVLCLLLISDPRTMSPVYRRNDRKFVVLIRKLRFMERLTCACGQTLMADHNLWEFEAAGGYELRSQCKAVDVVVAKEQHLQKYLIPIGDGSVASELLREQQELTYEKLIEILEPVFRDS